MNTLNSCGPDEPKMASWLRHVALGLLGLVVLVLLVLSFAVEFMATGVDFHRRAQSNDVPTALDGGSEGDGVEKTRPAVRGHLTLSASGH